MERPPEDTGPGESLSAGGSLPGSSRSQIERLRAENAWLRAELGSLRALQTQGEDSHGRILEGIPAAVFVTLVDGRVIELANRAGVELLGASDPAEVVGRSLLDFVHPDDLADALERGERAALGEPIAAVSQGRLIRLDGAEVVVERSVSRGTYRGKPILQSVLYDITARVRTEEALETSEARFRDLAESSLLGMSVVTADEPPRVLYANRAFKRIYGFAEDAELSGLHHLEALVAAHERSRIQRYRAARRAGRPAPDDYEHDAVRVDGSPITVRVHVNRLTRPWDGASALMLSFLDVTSQRQAEAALRESEARFRDFAAAASDWYWETDPVGRITFVSERFAEITGIDPGEVLGKTRDQALAGTLPADELAQEQKWARFRETLEAKRAYRDFTYRWIDREGALRTLSSSAVPVLGRDGEFFGYRGVGRDLTGEDATRRALDDERERLARAEATASLGNWEWRLDSGTVVWSSGMYVVAGVDPDRFVVDLDSATGIFAEEDLPAIRNLMRLTLKTHEPFSYRARIVRRCAA